MLNKVLIAAKSFRRESEKGFGYAANWFTRRLYYQYFHKRFNSTAPDSKFMAAEPLSIVVPAVDKDAVPLKHCLAAANQMIRHPVKAKWVVGPESEKLRALAQEAGWEFVHEDTLLPKPARELKCRGWVLQQFLKFNSAFHVPTDNYLVLDSDTVFLRPQVFCRAGRSILRYADQYELLYNPSLELIFGHNRRFPVSFVTHHMLFNKRVIKELLDMIEKRFKKEWWRAFLEEVDKGHLISFSEFELYGNYVMTQTRWKKQFALEYWHGLDSSSKDTEKLQSISESSQNRLNSVSFHFHTQ